jgi:BirA family biotin operon repressor/biotin-[acetyl-CoA-carboxylase] ligase
LPNDLLSLEHYQEEISDFHIHIHNTVSSTNEIAKNLALKGAPHNSVIIADSQTSGKGRFRRVWISPPGVNIYMSLCIKPSSDARVSLVPLATSVAVMDALCRVAPEIKGRIWLKWPNDIYLDEKKLSGILVENLKRDIIVGIGVNVNISSNRFPEDLREKATSLYIATGRQFRRAEIIVEILYNLREIYKILSENSYYIIQLWSERSKTLNSMIKAYLPDRTIEGKAIGLDENGFMKVITADGKMVTLSSADILHLR